MKARTAVAALCAVAGLSVGCGATARHKVLTFFFDGVPPLKVAGPAVPAAAPAPVAAVAQVRYREHGPYAAKLCNACHDSGATNALIVPRDQLCQRCHTLGLGKKYVHGPLASGGCLVCHDPHSSQYRALLVSASDSFCLRCHERSSLSKSAAHSGGEADCTRCHEAHMSDKRYLLR